MFLLKLDDTHSQPKIKAQNVIEEHLQVVIEAIYLYQHNKLTAEYMEKINHINRIYKL